MAKLPARSNFRTRTRRGASKTPDVRNVPRVRTSSDPGVSVPRKGVFGEYEAESLAETGQSMMGLSNTLFKVQNKLKKREDDRFLIEYEEGISKDFSGLVQKWDEAGDLGNPKHLESLQKEIENINANYEEPSANLSENGLIKFNAIKRQYNLSVATEIAKIYEAKRNAKNLQKIYNLSTTIANNPYANEPASISENFATFTDAFYDKYASQISENQEEGVIRDNLKNITRIQVDNLFRTNNDSDYDTIEQILSDPSVRELTVKPDGSRDKDFYGEVNSYWERLNRTKQDKTDIQKRFGDVSTFIAKKVFKGWDDPRIPKFLAEGKIPDPTKGEQFKELQEIRNKLPDNERLLFDKFTGMDVELSEQEKATQNIEELKAQNVPVSPELERALRGLPKTESEKLSQKIKNAIEIQKAAKENGQEIDFMQAFDPNFKPTKGQELKEEVEVLKELTNADADEIKNKYGLIVPPEKEDIAVKFLSSVKRMEKEGYPLTKEQVQAGLQNVLNVPKTEGQQNKEALQKGKSNTFEKIGELTALENIPNEEFKEKIEQILGYKISEKNLNAVQKLYAQIDSAKELGGYNLSEEQEEILIAKALGLPQSEAQKKEAADLEGELDAIKEKSKADTKEELGMTIDTGVGGESTMRINKLIVQNLGGEINLDTGTISLPPDKRQIALYVLVKAENLLEDGIADSEGEAVELALKGVDIPENPSISEIANQIIMDADSETKATPDRLENVEARLEKIKVSDATGLVSTGIDIWNSTAGQISESLVDKDVVVARQKLALLQGDFIAAFKRSSRLPVWEQQRLAKIFSGPDAFKTPGDVREALSEMERTITKDLKSQQTLLKGQKFPFDKRKEILEGIESLAQFRARIREFNIDLGKNTEIKTIKDVRKTSVNDLKRFSKDIGVDGLNKLPLKVQEEILNKITGK